MKKLFLEVSLLSSFLAFGFTDEYIISTIDCYDAKYFLEEQIYFKYDDEENLYYLQKKDYFSSAWYVLTPENLEILRANIKKALDWGKIAKENKTSISKELPDSQIKVSAIKEYHNEWYSSSRDITLTFNFLSVVEHSTVICSLVIYGNQVPSLQNQYIDIEFEEVIFTTDLIEYFYDSISPETIEAAQKQHEKQKEAEALFT